jgi:hypothetical protein
MYRLAVCAVILASLVCVDCTPGYASPKSAKPAQKSAPPAPTVPPQTRPEKASLCASMGKFAETIAKSRDDGIPMADLLPIIRQGFSKPEASQHMQALLVDIYQRKWMTPAHVRQQVEVDCVQAMAQ